ncbi:MAG: flotillin family protein [Planctomycetota bacterium]|nr:flotillin family protein [Planctomycetota bacterium]
MDSLPFWVLPVVAGAGVLFGFLVVFAIALSRFYRKVGPEEALVRSGGGKMIANSGAAGGMWVIPIVHRVDHMDLTVKRIEISRKGQNGLICRDNIRADIEVVFFVRVNNNATNIAEVAESIGCERASTRETLVELFDAKFSEALKTSGKKFDFADLYTERDKFKADILEVIGKDLNGYHLDDCAIDYLEQTPLEMLSPNNILDAEGIKKITELTAAEKVQENNFTREKEKTLKRQDVAADEVKFELEKQRVAAKEKQEREIAEVTAREQAQALKVQEEERLKSEEARIATAEAVGVAEENKNRQIIVAVKNKERTNAVETERVERDRQLEVTERERLVGVAQVEKDKAMEVVEREKQEVIRERVVVERGTVEEREKIKDTEAFYGADRQKKVAIVSAEEKAQEALVTEVKAAEASKQSASLLAEKTVIEAEAARAASEKEMQATKMLAEARTADSAAEGLAEAQVITAKADAQQKEGSAQAVVIEKKAVAAATGTEAQAVAEAKGKEALATAIQKEGTAEAMVIQRKAEASAKGKEANAVAVEKEGTAEATVMQLKYTSEAKGIEDKAEAMKLFDGVGREHEEFKLRLNKDKEIEIAGINAQTKIASDQSELVGEALKSARIDIVGGETDFFDKIVDSVKSGKAVDHLVHSSQTLTDVKNTFFNGNPEYFQQKLQSLVGQFDLSTDDVKDLSVAALIYRMLDLTNSNETRGELRRLLGSVTSLGISDQSALSALKLKNDKNSD